MENLKVDQKYTVFKIGGMAATGRLSIKIKKYVNGRPVFASKGEKAMGRKQFFLTVDHETLLFEGWDLPFKANTEYRSFTMNAMMNLVGDKEVIKDYIENKNLNPDFTRKDFILIWDAENYSTEGKNELLYPEAETTSKMVASLR